MLATPASGRRHLPFNLAAPGVRTLVKAGILAALIAYWFWFHAWRGAYIGFHLDDTMNLYFARRMSVRNLFLSNLVPFSHSYRPAGQALYRFIYGIAGFHPQPFRTITYLLILANVGLTFRFARRISGSAEIGVLAALIASFHPRLEDFYRNNGTIYDILCLCFFLLSLLYYMRLRSEGAPSVWHWLLWYALVTLTLNAKEVGFALAPMLWIYEALHAPPASPRATPQWFARGKLLVWMATALTVAAVWGKMTGDSAFRNNAGYALSFTGLQWLTTSNHYMSEMLFRPKGDSMEPWMIGLAFGTLLIIAAVFRRRYIWFLAVMAFVTALPVNFIPPRGLFAYCVAFTAWSAFAAAVLVEGRNWLYGRVWHRPPLPAATWEPERVGLFILTAFTLTQLYSVTWEIGWNDPNTAMNAIRTLADDLTAIHPKLPQGSRIMLQQDNFDTDTYAPLFTLQLAYHDKSLQVDRAKTIAPEGVEGETAKAQHVFAFQDGHWTERACRAPNP